jgi:hypothetical protein
MYGRCCSCGITTLYGYAVGIFLCPAAGVKSNRKSRVLADISNRPRYEKVFHVARQLPARMVQAPSGGI